MAYLAGIVVCTALFVLCAGQSMEQQAAVARRRCEDRLRAKGCSGITSSCDIKEYSYNCKCHASSCPVSRRGRAIYTRTQADAIRNKQKFRTNGCGAGGPTPCPSGYCCGPASPGSPDNMKICYPPGSPC